jgi:uncharacterized protein
MKRILVDTGPLLAIVHKRDKHHEWAVKVAQTLSLPWLTTEPVLTEVVYMIQEDGGDPIELLQDVKDGRIEVAFDLSEEISAVIFLMDKYREHGMQLADASLVRLSELEPDSEVWTLDRKDFSIYRRSGRNAIPLIAPPN